MTARASPFASHGPRLAGDGAHRTGAQRTDARNGHLDRSEGTWASQRTGAGTPGQRTASRRGATPGTNATLAKRIRL
ncbi:hypothetical protein GDP94_06270 [Bifidobacterium longum subsp. suillum]|nr:hypothetical protein [Bifidobacterium longum subsp. suillum]